MAARRLLHRLAPGAAGGDRAAKVAATSSAEAAAGWPARHHEDDLALHLGPRGQERAHGRGRPRTYSSWSLVASRPRNTRVAEGREHVGEVGHTRAAARLVRTRFRGARQAGEAWPRARRAAEGTRRTRSIGGQAGNGESRDPRRSARNGHHREPSARASARGGTRVRDRACPRRDQRRRPSPRTTSRIFSPFHFSCARVRRVSGWRCRGPRACLVRRVSSQAIRATSLRTAPRAA